MGKLRPSALYDIQGLGGLGGLGSWAARCHLSLCAFGSAATAGHVVVQPARDKMPCMALSHDRALLAHLGCRDDAGGAPHHHFLGKAGPCSAYTMLATCHKRSKCWTCRQPGAGAEWAAGCIASSHGCAAGLCMLPSLSRPANTHRGVPRLCPPDRYTVGCFLPSTEGMTSLISWPVVTSMPLLTLMMGRVGGMSSCKHGRGAQQPVCKWNKGAHMRRTVFTADPPTGRHCLASQHGSKPACSWVARHPSAHLDALQERACMLHRHRMYGKLCARQRLGG